MIQGEACSIFFPLGYGILQIQHDRIRLIDIRILDESRLLAVQEHHCTAKTVFVRIAHLITPPQLILPSCSAARIAAHSTLAFIVQSRAPLSIMLTLAFCTSSL